MADFRPATLNGVNGEARAQFRNGTDGRLDGTFSSTSRRFPDLADTQHPIVFEGVAFDGDKAYHVMIPVQITRTELPRVVHFASLGKPSKIEAI